RGPWTSGGVEHNFGLDLGHAPWAAAAVDYITLQNPDGSVTCVVGGLDLASRSEWRVKINLPKDKAYFETESMWFNPTPLHHAYLSWENAAFKASNDLQFYFPGNQHIGHDGLASPWPIDSQGRDLSLYRNNNFGDSKSYHVVGNYRNWFGGYWHDSEFGFGHWSPYSDAPGKKLWIWSLARSGAIWEDLLTDNDGQYIEAQSGAMFNQPEEKSGYHSPYRQLSHKPLYAETKSDYWFPVKDTKGMSDANLYGTLNVEFKEDSMYITVSPLQRIEDSLEVSLNGLTLLTELVKLNPLENFSRVVALSANNREQVKVNIGHKKLYYASGNREFLTEKPVRYNDSLHDEASAERTFRMAEEQYSMRNFDEAMNLYGQCIEKEPSHSEALSRISELYYRQAKYAEGLKYARLTLSFSLYDGSANYMYGAIQRKLGNYTEALEALSLAVRTMEYRSAAYAMIAEISTIRKDYDKAVVNANNAISYNKFNLTAYKTLAVAYRKQKHIQEARATLEALLAIDPLSHFARAELYFLQPGAEKLSAFTSLIANELPYETYLEIASEYSALDLLEEAAFILEKSPEHPMVYYRLAFLNRNHTGGGISWLQKATGMSPELVFPFRLEDIPVLEWAMKMNNSWKTTYYLGLIHWNNRDTASAKKLFQSCTNVPDYAPFYIARSALFSNETSVNDLTRSVSIDPKNWRAWQYLVNHYASENNTVLQLQSAEKAFGYFPSNPVTRINYAKALLNNGNPEKSIVILNKTLILPQEGAREGHEIYELASLALARNKMKQNKFKEALKYLNLSRRWPESLGEGRPYDPDERLQDLMAAYCEYRLGHPESVEIYRQKIKMFSIVPERWSRTRSPLNNYIASLVMQNGEEQSQLRELMQMWTNNMDSLSDWNISRNQNTPEVLWTLSKYGGKQADNLEIESKILNAKEETRFLILLNTLEMMKEKGMKFIN
ncbi:MAG: DUF5107 domain-containing protein, partial [Flavitalea sp.]